MTQRRKLGRKLLSFLLTLAMVVGLMPGMSMTVQAATTLTDTFTTNTGATEYTGDHSKVSGYVWSGATNKALALTDPNKNGGTQYGGPITIETLNGEIIDKVVLSGVSSSQNAYVHPSSGNVTNTLWSGDCRYRLNADGAIEIENINSTTLTISYHPGYGGTCFYANVVVYCHEVPVDITGVELNKTSTTLTVGETDTLTATVNPDNSDHTVAWSSDNESVATVSDGVVTAVAEGSATITATATNGTDDTSDDKTVTCTVTVKAAQTITASDVTATYGDTDKSVSASVTTPATGGGAISYTVKDGSVDYIDVASDGKLTIKKVPASGKAYVIVKAAATDDYAETTKEVTVTIAKADPETPTGMTGKYGQTLSTVSLPDGWSWAEDDTIMNAGVGNYTYQANYNPTDATNYNSLSDVDLTVNVGKGDGMISFGQTEVESTIGAEPPSVYFESTGDGVVTFTSDHENVATVNDNGYLTIKGVGETTITASVVDSATYQYATKSVSYKLIVKKRSVSIKTVPTASEITYGQTLADSKLSGGEVYGNIEGAFSWADSGVAPAVSDSETTEYAVKFTPKNSDIYAESTCNVKVKVNKAAAPATKESLSPEQKPAAKNADELVYTGEPIELVTAPTNPLEGYKVQYSNDNGTTWTDTIPTETNVGTYTVKAKYVSDNYENIDLDDITVEITTKEKAAFYAEKEVQKKAADDLAADGDSDASKKLIEDAKKAIDELAYDETKSLDENKAALAAIVSKLKSDLTDNRAAEKKEADDTAAAKKVTDAINALPASDKVATTDKAAIEAARKAYDALTDDQKAKVPAETLKKLEAAEKALADAEKNTSDDDKKNEEKPDYKNEWVDGQWYGANGNTEYKAKGSWKQNDKGWWYEDTDGWYPVSQWQMIDGKWYYFTADGYMDYSEYRDGCWLGSDGAWDETYGGGHWMQGATGWWYVDATGWYPLNRYLWVDGVQYWFNANGYWE